MKKTMYVVVRFDKDSKDNFAFHIYSKKHSNPEKMSEYKRELMGKAQYNHDCYEWYVMPEEKAKAEGHRYREWLKERDKQIVAQNLRKYWFNNLTDRQVVRDLMKNK